MAFMAPAPDQTFGGLSRSMSIPASYNTSAVMSPTDSMSSLSSLEKLMEPGGGVSCAPFSRSEGVSPTTTYANWAQAVDMQHMLGASATAPELLGSSMVSSDWQQLLDIKSTCRFASSSLPPVSMSMASAVSRGGIMENARIRELIAGRASNTGVQKSWSPMDGTGITVDPSKGGLALQGVGLATSHCLAQFTSDPAFAERAAKFSSFGNGKYSQAALPLPVNDVCKPRTRSSESSGKLSRTSSSQNSGAAKKLAAAVAAELEEKHSVVSAAAQVAAITEGCDMEVEVGNDKSPPNAALQPELEAIEGAVLANMDSAHEVEEEGLEISSCSEQQVSIQGGAGSSPATSPVRSASGSDDVDRRKRINSAMPDKPDQSPVMTRRSAILNVAEVIDFKPKRFKREHESKLDKDEAKAKAERSCSENSADSESPRAHKDSHKSKDFCKQDYIHVRARRGQATDSHSLAERVRREKISERMKYLQDLVPGCSKVTGKAVMLDEIINYVQSLQRQVEHLSMKLASVSPGPGRLDFNFESPLNKEILHSRLSSTLGGPERNATFGMFQRQHQQQGPMLGGPCGLDFRSVGTSMDGYLRRSNSAPRTGPSGLTAVDAFADDVSQSVGWDGELQSIVQMGFSQQGRLGPSIHEGLHCQLPVGHMKMEL